MPYFENLWLFFAVVFGVVVVPGLDMSVVLANTLTGGRRAGFAATFGVIVGGWFHAVYGILGVGILLKTWPAAFNILLLAGAAYIAWIGYSLLRSPIAFGDVQAAKPASLFAVFRQGALTNILNPKAYLFTLALYPQFLKAEYGPILLQALVLGAIVAATQFSVYGGVALAAAKGRDRLLTSPGAIALTGKIVGAVLILVAALTAYEGWRAI